MVIEQPMDSDILCGKDKTYSKHKGNILFRSKIMSMTTEYRSASNKPARMKLTKAIVQSLKTESNARFLRSVQGSDNGLVWEEISDQQARDKTSHALRFALSKEEICGTSSRSNKKYRRRSISTFGTTGNTSINSSDVKGTTRAVKKASQRPIVISRKGRGRAISRCSDSDSSSDTTDESTESDAVSTTTPTAYSGGHDHSQEQVGVEVAFRSNHQTIILNHNHRHCDTYSSSVVATLKHCNLQGVRSSPARLGGRNSRKQYKNSMRSQTHEPEVNFSSGWMVDRDDMTVRSDDLNDFLDQDITIDWNDNTNEIDNDTSSGNINTGGSFDVYEL
jgi:hypothetical protein